MDKRETKALDFEIHNMHEDGTFEGLASTYGQPPDVYGDIIEKGAFTRTISDHKGEVVVLWQHDQREPVGLGQLEDTDEGLVIKGKLEMDLPTAQKAYIALKARLVRGLSIGFRTIRKKADKGIRILKEIKLFEVSLVTFPANERALVTGVKSAFSDAMDERASASNVWGAYSVLASIIFDRVFDGEMTTEDKVTEIGDAIDEFKSVFLTALPDYLKIRRLGSDPEKSLTPDDAQQLQDEIKTLQAILSASGVETPTATAKEADAAPEAHDDAFHPVQLEEFRDSLVTAIRN